eukprot:gb/GECH01004302.1/.p1 GENE.gb/GECH01004302.1/~~gb/GECH01004302.1/.p1  ORF type:complete len:215 (+),score=41.20 gb/GECH01004302.1/:1-645(+)
MTDDTKSLYLVAAAPSEDHRIEQLINVGADPNWRNPEDGGKTPLHNAILHTNKMGALYLLEGGADPSIVDNHLSTPLHIAAQMGDDFVTNVLLDMSHVDSLSLPDQDGNHPLHYAAQLSTCLVLTALINNAVYIDPVNSLTRETPLHVAARNDRVEGTIALYSRWLCWMDLIYINTDMMIVVNDRYYYLLSSSLGIILIRIHSRGASPSKRRQP